GAGRIDSVAHQFFAGKGFALLRHGRPAGCGIQLTRRVTPRKNSTTADTYQKPEGFSTQRGTIRRTFQFLSLSKCSLQTSFGTSRQSDRWTARRRGRSPGGGKYAWKSLERWGDVEAALTYWAKKSRWRACLLRHQMRKA